MEQTPATKRRQGVVHENRRLDLDLKIDGQHLISA